MESNKDIKEIESKWEHIPLNEFLKEAKRRAEAKMISRRDLLELAGIYWCLECGEDCEACEEEAEEGKNTIEENGYCRSCNGEWGAKTQSESGQVTFFRS